MNDPELGRLPTCPACKRVLVSGLPHLCDSTPKPLLPWFPVIILAYALAFITLAGLSIKFYMLGHADRKEIRK